MPKFRKLGLLLIDLDVTPKCRVQVFFGIFFSRLRFLQGDLQNSLHFLNFVENFQSDKSMHQESSYAQQEAVW